jgi:uncharacterized protein with HEPN domain
MSRRKWKLYVEDILESLDLVKQYIGSMDSGDFKEDRKTIDAVVRNLEIIGEASKFIPDRIKSKYCDVDWPGMVGLRNRIAHKYFDISLNVVWRIIKNELPTLDEQMRQILQEEK